jgi:cytochrome c biogenesis protein CcmG, thiol:disulfide interchange protein DsbE
MILKTKLILAAVVLAVVVVGGYLAEHYWIQPASAEQASSSTRPDAPNFKLTDIFGKPLELNQYQGKVVLLDFWATYCGPCRAEIPGFVKLQQEYGNQGFQVIGISEDEGGVAPVRDFYRQMGLNYPVALDDGKVGELYGGIIGIPTNFLIGRNGRIYDKIPGEIDDSYWVPQIQSLLAASPNGAVKGFHPLEGSEAAQVESLAQVNSSVPGVDVSTLSKTQLARYKDLLRNEKCTCGCNVNVLRCRRIDPACTISLKMAQAALKKLESSKPST